VQAAATDPGSTLDRRGVVSRIKLEIREIGRLMSVDPSLLVWTQHPD